MQHWCSISLSISDKNLKGSGCYHNIKALHMTQLTRSDTRHLLLGIEGRNSGDSVTNLLDVLEATPHLVRSLEADPGANGQYHSSVQALRLGLPTNQRRCAADSDGLWSGIFAGRASRPPDGQLAFQIISAPAACGCQHVHYSSSCR